MENPRAEKVAVVDEVRQRLGTAGAAFLTEYRGLKVKDLAVLRRSLSANGGEYKIYKNTLVRFAARDLGFGDLDELLVGPTAVTFVNGDAAGVAKALRDFSRTHPLLLIKGGILGDKIIGPAEAGALAELPPREVLLARFAGGLAAPLRQLAGLLQAVPSKLAYGLQALIDQRIEGGESAPAVAAPDQAPPAAASDEPPAVASDEPVAVAAPHERPEAVASDEPVAVAAPDERPAQTSAPNPPDE